VSGSAVDDLPDDGRFRLVTDEALVPGVLGRFVIERLEEVFALDVDVG
jgi:hypothetical protein